MICKRRRRAAKATWNVKAVHVANMSLKGGKTAGLEIGKLEARDKRRTSSTECLYVDVRGCSDEAGEGIVWDRCGCVALALRDGGRGKATQARK